MLLTKNGRNIYMFNNLNSTLKKVVVIFLIITLTYANLVLIDLSSFSAISK